MMLVYIISAYKLPEQLIRLVHKLNTDSALFFIHVDRNTDERVYGEMVNGLIHLPNVRFVKRHRCYWGGFGHVAATLEAIHEICRTGACFDYALLLTGQDYPIKSNDEITAFFEQNQPKLFLEFFSLPHEEWQNYGMDRIQAWHWRIFHRYFKFAPDQRFLIQRHFPKGFKPFGGSSYWCLSRECIEYIHEFTKQNRSFINFFKFVEVPDEIFFQTILLNSRFKQIIVNDCMRYMEWNDPTSGSPAILGKNDLPKLLISSKLFARKFDMNVDSDILDLIDREISVIA